MSDQLEDPEIFSANIFLPNILRKNDMGKYSISHTCRQPCEKPHLLATTIRFDATFYVPTSALYIVLLFYEIDALFLPINQSYEIIAYYLNSFAINQNVPTDCNLIYDVSVTNIRKYSDTYIRK